MNEQLLNIEAEFNLMVIYQINLESKSVIVENSPKDKDRYSLYEAVAPFPSYIEFINGNSFDEGRLLRSCDAIEELHKMQEIRRKGLKVPVLA